MQEETSEARGGAGRSNPLRVLMLHNDYLQVGGERHSVAAEFNGLSADPGIQVELLQVGNESMARGIREQARVLLDDRAAFELVDKQIRNFEPDIVHVQNLFPTLGGGALRAISAHGLPYVRTLRNYRLRCVAGTLFRDGRPCTSCASARRGVPGVIHGCYRNSRPASFAAVVYASRESAQSRKGAPAAFILLSNAMRRHLEGVLEDEAIYVKPNAVTTPSAERVADSDKQFDVCFVGRLTQDKRADLALTLSTLLPDLRFVVVGEGPLSTVAEERASDSSNLTYRGAVSHEEAIRTMAGSRLVIVPSAWDEPFGRVAAESLSVGTPALVSNRGGLPDIVADLSADLAVERDDDSGWADAIRQYFATTNALGRDRLSEECVEKWRTTYSPPATTARLIGIYESVLAGS